MNRVAIIIAILCSTSSIAQNKWQLFDDLHSIGLNKKDTCLNIKLIVDSLWPRIELQSNCISWDIISKKGTIVKHDTTGIIVSKNGFLLSGYCNCVTCSKKSRTFFANDTIIVTTCQCDSPEFSYRIIQPPLTSRQKKWKKSDWKTGDHVDLENLLFYPDKSTFLPESFEELDSLSAMLKRFPKLKIEIQGHVNGPGSRNTEEFKVLSENRAKAVYNYLISKNIASNRIIYKGYGNTKMRFPKPKTDSEMESNRRVEIIVLEQ